VNERPRRVPNWEMVFNNLPDEATIMATYHQLAKKYHPDNGGSTEIMQAINAARDAALIDLKNPAPPSADIEKGEEEKKEAEEEQGHEEEGYEKEGYEKEGYEEEGHEEEGHEEEGHVEEEQEFAVAPALARRNKLTVTLGAGLLTSVILILIYPVARPQLANQAKTQSTSRPQAQPLPASSGCTLWNIEHTHCRKYQWLDSSTTTQESTPIISRPQVLEKAAIKLQEGQEGITPTPQKIQESFDDVVVDPVDPAPQILSSIVVSQEMADWHNKIAFMLQGRSIRMSLPRHGRVVISFTVDRNGYVLERHIRQSSGFLLLDREVLNLVVRVQPFPPIPPDYERNSKVVTANLGF
jgi:TonB family protein